MVSACSAGLGSGDFRAHQRRLLASRPQAFVDELRARALAGPGRNPQHGLAEGGPSATTNANSPPGTQPLTEPAVRLRTMCFSKIRKKITIGMAASTVNALIAPQCRTPKNSKTW